MRRPIALLLLLIATCSCAERRARNVILFLGDAGGIPTLHAASVHAYEQPRQLFIHGMPHLALSDTSSHSEWVSDSAAGMTAIVTGARTHNGVVSQSAAAVRGRQDGAPLKTILEHAEERGLSTGVVSNSSVLSATPAACYAHVNDRRNTGEIFRQLLEPQFGDGVDVVIGAGRGQVLEAARLAGLDAGAAFDRAGLEWHESLDAARDAGRRAVVLFDGGDFDLGAAVQRAIDILSRNPEGFFLMVESDLHTEDIVRGLERTVALDRVIRQTAERMGGDTLILFTADHSYDLRVHDGGKDEPLLTPAEAATPTGDIDTVRLQNVRRDDDHTGEEVLVGAMGPGAERVRGVLSSTDLFHIMAAALGWDLPVPERR